MRLLTLVSTETPGGRVRTLRTKQGWSLADLAKRAGVSKSYIGRLEQGDYANPGGPNLSRLADCLGVSVTYLLTGDEPLPRESYPADLLPLFDMIARVRVDEGPAAARRLERVVRAYLAEDEAMRPDVHQDGGEGPLAPAASG